MKKFTDLAQIYSDWLVNNNISTETQDNMKYLWAIPNNALEAWKHEFDDQKDKFTEQMMNTYQNMFKLHGTMLGFTIGAVTNDNYARLYKLTQKTYNWTLNNILCSGNLNLINYCGISKSVTLGSYSVENPFTLTPKTLQINNDEFDLRDTRAIRRGTCCGQGYLEYDRNTNRKNKESWLATIDYMNGDFHIVRSNTDNEKKFIDYYNMLIKMINSVSTRSFTLLSGFSTTVKTISYVASNVTPYDYVNIRGIISAVGNPTTKVLEMDIRDNE